MPKKTSQKQVIDDEDEVNTFHNYIHITFFKYIRWTLFILKIYTEQLHDNDSARHFPIYIFQKTISLSKSSPGDPFDHQIMMVYDTKLHFIYSLPSSIISLSMLFFFLCFSRNQQDLDQDRQAEAITEMDEVKWNFSFFQKMYFEKRLKRWKGKWPGIFVFFI